MKAQRVLIIAIFALMVVVNSVLAYWLFRPYHVYTFEQPYKVVTPVVSPGDKVVVKQTYCKNLDLPARITISIADGYYEVLRVIDSSVEPGCYNGVSGSAFVPFTTPPGEYRIQYLIRVRVNPIREIDYIVTSEMFTVQ